MQAIRRLRDLAAENVAAITVALAVLIGASSWYQVSEMQKQAEDLNRISECQHEYNIAFDQQLRIRSSIFQRADDTRNDLIGGIARLTLARKPVLSVEGKREYDAKVRQLFDEYLKAIEEVERARKGTPLPPIPNC